MSWRDEAKCRGMDLSIFYVGGRPDQERVIPQAKAACDSCPVRSECLEDAIKTRDFDGVRAGLIGRERRTLWKARQALIPKKERHDHGTRSGYFWELERGMPICRLCLDANNRYHAKRRGGYLYGPRS